MVRDIPNKDNRDDHPCRRGSLQAEVMYFLGCVVLTLGMITVLRIQPAFAHHFMDGVTPTTPWQALLAGFGHPIIELDHLAALIAVGLMAARSGKPAAILPVAWVFGVMEGALLHLWLTNLPPAEPVIAISVIVLGTVASIRKQPKPFVAGCLFAIAGILHGHALAQPMIEAAPGPLGAYLLGVSGIQAVIAIAVALVGRYAWDSGWQLVPIGARLAGIAVVSVGVFSLTGNLVSVMLVVIAAVVIDVLSLTGFLPSRI